MATYPGLAQAGSAGHLHRTGAHDQRSIRGFFPKSDNGAYEPVFLAPETLVVNGTMVGCDRGAWRGDGLRWIQSLDAHCRPYSFTISLRCELAVDTM